jgi:hypothetical protein
MYIYLRAEPSEEAYDDIGDRVYDRISLRQPLIYGRS